MATGEEVGNRVLAAIKGFVEKQLASALDRIKALEDRPAPQQGDRGEPGPAGVGIKGDKGEPGDRGADGKSVTIDDVRPLLEEAVKAIPAPKAGKDGENGEPGRDALQIEILPSIDPARSYARGTYASYRGGVVRAARTTDYLDEFKSGETIETKGWQIVLNGIGDREMEQLGEREFVMRLVDTAGKKMEMKFAVPMMIYRGVWREGQFKQGDCVTWGGSLFHCNKDTAEKPGTGKDWQLAVKRGADGKDKAS